MAESGSIVPGSPLIPEQPPAVIVRQLTEWADRADLAEHAFDGQWRVCITWEQFGLQMMQRWTKADDGVLDRQNAVVPIGTLPENVTPQAMEMPAVVSGMSKFVAWIKHRRANGEAIGLEETLLEILCLAMPGK